MGSAGFPDSFLPDDYPEDGDSARREEGLHGDGMGEYRDMLRRVALKPAREALERLAKECLQREAYLMDVAILSSRSAAQLVVAAVGCPSLVWVHSLPIPDWGAGNPEDYLQAKVLEALQDLMLEDANADQMGFEQPDPREPRHLYLEDWFHI
ncbi:MAG TPA: hypothetical protein P5218_09165, partial [Planctomycetota bacterium]|nr:hypothetical protein [Planctomycetota bacterium]